MVKAVADTICTGIQLSEHHIATTWHSCYKFGKLMADYGSGVEQGFFFFFPSEGRWLDSPGLHVEVSLGNPKLLLMCWSALCMAATTISL